MANVTDLCPACGVSLANHVCPQRVGTVPGVVTTYTHNGASVTKVVRAASKNNACSRCGLVHHNERGTKIVCTISAASRYYGVKIDPNSATFYRMVADFLDYEAGNTSALTVQNAPALQPKTASARKVATAQNVPVVNVPIATSTPVEAAPTIEAAPVEALAETPAEAKKRKKALLAKAR